MKNFQATLTSKFLSKIIFSHDGGIIGNEIPKKILKEMKYMMGMNLQLGNCKNAGISDETIDFLDDFISDVQNAQMGNDCSVYARNFIEWGN